MYLLRFKIGMLPIIVSLLLLFLTSCSSDNKTNEKLQSETSGVAVLLVDTDHPMSTIDKNIYGHFLEHINHSVEDGLYAEQVQGQGFEEKDWEIYWKPLAKSGKVELVNTPFEKGSKSIRLAPANGTAAIRQQRFYIQKGVRYDGSVWVKHEAGNPQLSLLIQDAGNNEIATASLPYSDTGWHELPFAFTA
ncbi:MAG: carbohydrate binding domain-containing protein, partial [Flavisolibacter sp.]|nr:carbohydrate binding domain-containing protein [Flavisolibacter sp.]